MSRLGCAAGSADIYAPVAFCALYLTITWKSEILLNEILVNLNIAWKSEILLNEMPVNLNIAWKSRYC